ncbi:hypothetical protein ACVWWQ_002919 [Rhodanobacter sp. TND4EL1]
MTSTRWQLAWPWLALLLVALLVAWLRYGVVEPGSMAQQCGGGHGPWWCPWRQWLVWGFLHNVYGIAAVVATVAALLWRRPWLAWLAAALGIVALQLYCFESGALALLLGCLRLIRLQADRLPPRAQHRDHQQQIHTQP